MEKEIKINTKDKHIIYGTLVSEEEKSDTLVVFVHGLIGSRNDHILFNGSKYFLNKGIDTFRFDLYPGEEDSRHFEESSISTHGKDTHEVIENFRKDYKKVFLVGHSYGGTALLFVDSLKVDGFIFWDASYVEMNEEKSDMVFNKALDAYVLDWGMRYVIGKDFVNELNNFPDCGKLISSIKLPVFFVSAANEAAALKFMAKANEPKQTIHIEETTHGFDTFKGEERLFEETYNWIKKYI